MIIELSIILTVTGIVLSMVLAIEEVVALYET